MSGVSTFAATVLFAQAAAPGKRPATAYTMTDLLLPFGAVIVALLVLAVVVFVMKRWYERSRKEEEDASSFLSEARELEEEGELSREEYLKIKAKLAEGLRGPAEPEIKGGDPAKRAKPLRRQNPPNE